MTCRQHGRTKNFPFSTSILFLALLLLGANARGQVASTLPEVPAFEITPAGSAVESTQTLVAPRIGETLAPPADTTEEPRYGGNVPFLSVINDPIESFNRAMFAFDDQLINLVIDPLTRGYRNIAPEPVRKSIRKAGLNLAYPVRLVNTLLQGKGEGALSETGRFLINSTIGLLGFFDPATRIGLEAYNEDFGQTFGTWGYDPGFYLVLPFLGPTSGRDALGSIFDMVLNPATLIPGANVLFGFNRMSFTIPTYMSLRTVQHDLYPLVRDIQALSRKKDVVDFAIKVKDIEPDPTLKSLYIKLSDQEFPKKALEFKAMIPATSRKLPYSAWLQSYPAPLVFVLGGTGSHRMSESTMALGEILFNDRFSVVTISSAMNTEFMENAATAAVPGYPKNDAVDVYKALDSIYHDLRRRYPGRFTRPVALMGISLGGIHTLYISSFAESMPQGMLRFERYLAIDTPTDLIYALENLDDYYTAPLAWKQAEREQKMEETLLKAATLAESTSLDPATELPFNKIESRYLIGLFFKLILRDVIYSSQQRADLGVLKANLHRVSRQQAYDEIDQYSFMDYMNLFVVPYYMKHPNFRIPREELLRNSSLRPIENELRRNTKIRAFINESDFFLRPEDFQWYKDIVGNRLTVLSRGGHMGNLYLRDVQQKIVEAIQDIKDIKTE